MNVKSPKITLTRATTYYLITSPLYKIIQIFISLHSCMISGLMISVCLHKFCLGGGTGEGLVSSMEEARLTLPNPAVIKQICGLLTHYLFHINSDIADLHSKKVLIFCMGLHCGLIKPIIPEEYLFGRIN